MAARVSRRLKRPPSLLLAAAVLICSAHAVLGEWQPTHAAKWLSALHPCQHKTVSITELLKGCGCLLQVPLLQAPALQLLP